MRFALRRSYSWSFVPTAGIALLAIGCSGLFGAEPNYNDYSKTYQQRPIVAPGMGLDNKPEPSAMQKFGSSLAAVPKAIGNSAKSGANKVKDWMTPDEKPETSSSNSGFDIGFSGKKTPGPEIYVATAAIYEKAGNYQVAAEQYEKALKASPNHLNAMLSYAHMLDRQGQLDRAAQLYEAAAKKHPNEATAHNDLGLCYARRGMMTEATRSLSKAIELQPKRELYRNNLASVLVEMNRSDDALAQLKALQSEAIAHYNLGYLLQQRGREQLAASHFQRAAMLDPTFTAARLWSEKLAQRTPPGAMQAAVARPPAQVASVPEPMQRPVSYGIPPTPGPAPNYLRGDPPPGSTVAGNRYRSFNPSIPPTPDQVDRYKPELGSDLQFLPPVE